MRQAVKTIKGLYIGAYIFIQLFVKKLHLVIRSLTQIKYNRQKQTPISAITTINEKLLLSFIKCINAQTN